MACVKRPCGFAVNVGNQDLLQVRIRGAGRLTDITDGFLEMGEIDVGCQVAFARTVEHVHYLVVFECLRSQGTHCQSRVKVNSRRRTRSVSPNALSSP
jgi:hypothetical protein